MKRNFESKISDYNLNNYNMIGKGYFSEVYQISDNEVLKVYQRPAFYTAYSVLKKLKHFDLESFYKIFKLYTDNEKRLLGYVMKYYKPENIDILTMPKDFILDNYAKMYQDMIYLSYKGIQICDLDIHNIILNSDGITILDADNYAFSRLINRSNIDALNNLFINLFCYHLGLYHIPDGLNLENFNKVVKNDLFNFEMEPVTLARTLKRYQTPIDYIKRKSK